MALAMNGRDSTRWRPEPRIFLQPVAAPSVLGYLALSSALIIYGTWFAGAWGSAKSAGAFAPFIFFFGGVGQFAAAMWAYRARNAVAAAFNGSWSAFWLGVAIMYLLVVGGIVEVPARGASWGAMGQWLMYMAVISWTTAFASLARNFGGFLAQAVLGSGAAIAAAALMAGAGGWAQAAGWVFVAAGVLCFYVGAALMLDNVYGIVVLPLLQRGARNNVPGRRPAEPVQYEDSDPGVKVGQ